MIFATTTPAAWPTDLIQRVTATANLPSHNLMLLPFAFELSLEAAHKNFCILRQYGSIGEAIKQNPNSPMARAQNSVQHYNWKRFYNSTPTGQNSSASSKKD
jgi:hypothetical protein